MQSNTKDLMIMIILSSFILSLKQHIAKHLNKVNTDLSRIAPCLKKEEKHVWLHFFVVGKINVYLILCLVHSIIRMSISNLASMTMVRLD